jgi:hypothetical protein
MWAPSRPGGIREEGHRPAIQTEGEQRTLDAPADGVPLSLGAHAAQIRSGKVPGFICVTARVGAARATAEGGRGRPLIRREWGNDAATESRGWVETATMGEAERSYISGRKWHTGS